MKIIRFIDDTGQILYGHNATNDRATILTGDPYTGFKDTAKQARIARYLAPVEPRAILCIGANYKAHAQEFGAPLPEYPVLFMKNPATLNHHREPIVIPEICRNTPQVDYEVELAVVIGKDARDVCADDALDYVLGYTIANDVTARWWQKSGSGGQWGRGKSFDTFCPMGPALVTTDELTDPQKLQLSTKLNGQVMQDANTADMIFPIATLIEQLSSGMTLLAGTVLLTGTPSGIGEARDPKVHLKHGDVLELTIEQIGTLTNPVVFG